MRKNYPFSTYEFNDIILSAYENLVYLLGNGTVSGLYDKVDYSGVAFMSNLSGIPHAGVSESNYYLGLNTDSTSDVIKTYLRSDYLFRKQTGVI